MAVELRLPDRVEAPAAVVGIGRTDLGTLDIPASVIPPNSGELIVELDHTNNVGFNNPTIIRLLLVNKSNSATGHEENFYFTSGQLPFVIAGGMGPVNLRRATTTAYKVTEAEAE